MSKELIFNKLDEKISSLVRSLGLIITILFGLLSIAFNFFELNWIVIIVTILLLILFLTDVIYVLKIYIYNSPENYDMIEKIKDYEILVQISRELWHFVVFHNPDISINYDNLKNYDILIMKYQEILQKNIDFSEKESSKKVVEYQIGNIKDLLPILRNLINIIKIIRKNLSVEETKGNLVNYHENLIKFYDSIEKYEFFEFDEHYTFTYALDDNPFDKISEYINQVYVKLANTLFGKIKILNNEKNKYENQIRKCYILFGLIILLSIGSIFLLLGIYIFSLIFPKFN